MTDSVLPNRVAPPKWLLTMVGGVIVVGAITFFANLLDNSTYFGFSHTAAIQTLTALVAVPAAIATGVSLWLYVPSVRGGSFGRVVFSLYAGCMGGGAVAAIFFNIATQIDHQVLFPASTTHTLTDVEAPIADAYTTHGKNHGWFITLPPVPQALRITQTRYKAILAQRRDIDPILNPEEFRVAGSFCARLTLQLSGQSARILNTGEIAISAKIHPCPMAFDDVLARLSQSNDRNR